MQMKMLLCFECLKWIEHEKVPTYTVFTYANNADLSEA